MLSLQYSPQSTNKECQEKAAARYLVSNGSPNRSIDEDLRCSAHWGTKTFYCNASLQGVSGLYRGCLSCPCCSLSGWDYRVKAQMPHWSRLKRSDPADGPLPLRHYSSAQDASCKLLLSSCFYIWKSDSNDLLHEIVYTRTLMKCLWKNLMVQG